MSPLSRAPSKANWQKQAHNVALDEYVYDKEGSSIAKQREVRFKSSQKLLEGIAPDEYAKDQKDQAVPVHIIIERFIKGDLVENQHLGGMAALELGKEKEIVIDTKAGQHIDQESAPMVELDDPGAV